MDGYINYQVLYEASTEMLVQANPLHCSVLDLLKDDPPDRKIEKEITLHELRQPDHPLQLLNCTSDKLNEVELIEVNDFIERHFDTLTLEQGLQADPLTIFLKDNQRDFENKYTKWCLCEEGNKYQLITTEDAKIILDNPLYQRVTPPNIFEGHAILSLFRQVEKKELNEPSCNAHYNDQQNR